MIRRIVIENFMSHVHTVIEPADGLTVLVGPNNCGKSAVIAALQALCRNERGDYMIRHDADTAKVTVETDDGHVVSWRKKRGQGGAFTIDGKNESRLGANVPDDLHNILRLPPIQTEREAFDIHFGEQKSPIFLIDGPPSKSAFFFASASDARLLLEMQKRHRQNVIDRRREVERLTGDIACRDAELAVLEPLDDIHTSAAALEDEYQHIQRSGERQGKLAGVLARHERTTAEGRRARSRDLLLRELRPPPDLAPTAPLDSLSQRISALVRDRERDAQRNHTLLALALPPALPDADALDRRCEALARADLALQAAQQRVALMADVQPLPSQSDTAPLIALLAQWRQIDQRRAALREKSSGMAGLAGPPDCTDLAPIAGLIDKLRSLHDESRTWQQALAQLDAECRQSVLAIEAWAREHPLCPTCGANVTAERLLGEPAHAH